MELVDTATEAMTVVVKDVIDKDTFKIPNEKDDVKVDTKNLDDDEEEILIQKSRSILCVQYSNKVQSQYRRHCVASNHSRDEQSSSAIEMRIQNTNQSSAHPTHINK